MNPNIVIAVLDTARAQEVQDLAREAEIDSTIEGLMENGTNFSNAYTTSPWTLPSHASLFTGTYPSRHGANADTKSMRDDLPTLASKLTAEGYESIGFTNNPWVTDTFGVTEGFDRVDKVWQYIQSDTDFGKISISEAGLNKLISGARALFSGNPLVNLVNAFYGQFLYRRYDYGAKRTNELVNNWLTSRENEDPFFLFLNYVEPHLEYRPQREYAQNYIPEEWNFDDAMDIPQNAWAYLVGEESPTEQEFEILRALYQAEIHYMDDRIGQLISHLKAEGEWNETIFVLCGDHGENIGDHGLMDHQYSLHDTVLNVPLVITGGVFNNGGTKDELVQLCDLYPTLLDAAEVEYETTEARSFHPDQETGTRERIYAEYLYPQPSIDSLEERFENVPDSVFDYDRGLRAIQTAEYKLIVGSDGSVQLYEAEEQVDETNDLSEAQPDVVDSMRSDLNQWIDLIDRYETTEASDMNKGTQQRLENLGYLQ